MYLIQFPTSLPKVDLKLLTKISKIHKKSRAVYTREALDEFDKNPEQPEKIPRAKTYLQDGQRVPVVLLLEERHIEIMKKYAIEYDVNQIEVLRQAVVNKAIREGDKWEPDTPVFQKEEIKVDPTLENLWLKATDIYTPLGIKRNSLYVVAQKHNIAVKKGRHIKHHAENLYPLGPIIRALRLTDEQVNAILKKALHMGEK